MRKHSTLGQARKTLIVATAMAGFSPLVRPLLGQTVYTWKDAGTNWGTGSNWSPSGPPTSSDTALFSSQSTISFQPSVNDNQSASAVSLDNSGVDWQLNGSGALSIGSGGLSVTSSAGSSHATGISPSISLTVNQNWTVGSSNTVTATSDISGSANLTLIGGGTLTLLGTHTLSGTVAVNVASLLLGTSGNAGGTVASAAAYQINSRGAIVLNNSAGNATRLQTTSGISVNNGGTLGLVGNAASATSQTTGAVTLNSGAFSVAVTPAGSGATTLALGAITRSNGSNAYFLSTSGALGGAATGPIITISGASNTNGILGGWATAGGDFATIGANGVTALSTYTNLATTSNTSTTNYVHSVTGATDSTINLAQNSTLNALKLSSTSTGRPIVSSSVAGRTLTLSSGGVVSTATGGAANAIQGGGNLLVSGAGGADLVFTIAGGTFQFSARMQSGSPVVKAGAGTMLFDGGSATANSYTGDTFVNDGVLRMENSAALPSATTYRINGGILEAGQASTAISRPISLNAGGLRANGSAATGRTFSGVITIGSTPGTLVTLSTGLSDQTLTLNNGAANALTGGSATSVINVLGPGTISLNDTSSYAGRWLISGGTLQTNSQPPNLGTSPATAVPNYIELNGGAIALGSGSPGSTRGFTLDAGGGTINVSSTNTSTINGIVAGPGSLFKTNTGTLVLGSSDNTYSGSTNVLQGVVSVVSGGPLGNAPSSVTDNIFLNGGTLLFTGSVTSTPLSANRRVVLGPTGASGTGTIAVADTKTVRVAGALKNNTSGTGALGKEGLGTLQLESTASSYTGNTFIQSGTINAAASGALGSGGTVFVGNGGSTGVAAALNISADAVTISNPLWTNKDGGSANNLRTVGYTATSGTGTYSGQLEVNGGVALRAAAGGTQVMSGVIKNGTDASAGVNRDVLVNLSGGTNSGTVVFSNANTYTGVTAIDAGALRIDPGGSIANTSGVFVGSGALTSTAAALYLGGASGGVTLSNNLTINPGASGNRALGGSNSSGTNTFAGNVAMGGSFGEDRSITVTASSGGNVSFTGIVSGAGQNVTKNGGGVVYFGGANTYTGTTTVSGGTLRVIGTHSGGDSYTVGSTGSIGGSGVITLASSKSFTLNGNVSPGNSTGNLTVTGPGNDSTTVFAGGGSYTLEINANNDHGGTAGGATGWDLFTIDTVSVTANGGSKFTVQVVGVGITNGANWDPDAGEKHFKIVDHNGAGTGFTAGDLAAFDVVVSGFEPDENLGGFYLNVDGGGDLELVYVPEPTSLISVSAVASAALLRRRRSRR